MPVGAAVTVDVSILWGELRYFTTAEPPSITLAEGGNSIGVTLRRAFKDGSSFGAILAKIDGGEALPLGDYQPLLYEHISGADFGFSLSSNYSESDGRTFAWYLNGKKLSGTGGEISLSSAERAYIQTAGDGAENPPENSIICVFGPIAGVYYAAESRFTVAAPLAGTLASVNASADSGAALQQGGTVTFSHGDANATIHLTVSPTDGVTRGGDAISGEVTGNAGQSITLAFNNAATSGNLYTVTAWATRSGYADSQKTTFTYTVQGDALAMVGITTSDGAALPMATYGGNANTYLLGTDISTLRVSLQTGSGAYTDGNVSWTVTADGSVNIAPTGTDAGNCTFTLPDLATGTHTLKVTATVDGTSVPEQTFNILKFSNGGNFTLSESVIIGGGALTIAPESGALTIQAPANTPAFTIISGGTLTLGGGAGTVTINGNENATSVLVRVNEDGTLKMENNATLQNNKRRDNGGNGGGVYVQGGAFTMSGGKISSNSVSSSASSVRAYGGGVYMNSGMFTMNDGEISDNRAYASAAYHTYFYAYGGGVYVNSGTFTINGGKISGNNAYASDRFDTTAYADGGGVYVSGSFTMSGGTISGNTADYNGGGVYVRSGTFEMSDGEIRGNTASEGGGVYVGHSYVRSSNGTDVLVGGTFTMSGGKISGNTANSDGSYGSGDGGGVYVDGTFEISGGEISKNTANSDGRYGSGGGGGVYVSSDGTFTMSGNVQILNNTASYGGGVYVGGTFTYTAGDISGNNLASGASGTGVDVNVASGAIYTNPDGNTRTLTEAITTVEGLRGTQTQ